MEKIEGKEDGKGWRKKKSTREGERRLLSDALSLKGTFSIRDKPQNKRQSIGYGHSGLLQTASCLH
jgi:hypothetical protein